MPAASTGANRLRPLLALTLLLLLWGLSVPVMKLGLTGLSPTAMVSLRYLFAAPCFVPFLIGRRLPRRRAMAAMAGLAVLGLVGGQVLQVIGIQRTSAVVATIITATIPIFTVLLAVVRLRQSVRWYQLAGLGLALAGIALATAGTSTGSPALAATAATGDACLLLSSVCIAAYYVLSAELAISEGVVAVSAWSTIFGAVMLSPLAAWSVAAHQVRWTPLSLGVLVYLGLLVTVFGMWIWLHALRTLPARVAASSQYVQPLIGIFVSAAIFGTPLGGGFAAGSALVLAGIALCSVSRPHP